VSRWSIARLEDIPLVDDGRVPMRTVRHHLGIQAFGINAFVSRGVGEAVINDHDEADTGDEELYLVLSGHAVFTVDGEEVDAREGTLLLVEPQAKRGAVAKAAGTTILAVGAVPGKAYSPSGWELQAAAMVEFRAGDYYRAIDLLQPLVEQHPEYPGLTYNLACAESLAGRHDDALAHLRQALEAEAEDSLRELARNDSDFDPIREDPRFAELFADD
jgi:quercetin dioxygenase-like cupin family protein